MSKRNKNNDDFNYEREMENSMKGGKKIIN
jgi:hypothetical protein